MAGTLSERRVDILGMERAKYTCVCYFPIYIMVTGTPGGRVSCGDSFIA